MNFALISVSIGTILTLFQVLGLRWLLDTDSYVNFRTVINTANNLAPFLCLGFDAAAAKISNSDKNFPFFWNILVFHGAVLMITLILQFFFPISSKMYPIVIGVGMSTFLAASIILSNYLRSEGNFFKYFLNMNITEKSARTLAILGCAYLFKDLLVWFSATIILYALALLIRLIRIKIAVKLNMNFFVLHIRQALPFLVVSSVWVVLTRLPYYMSYFFRDSENTARLDIILLFSLFILIPFLNRSKIDEVNSRGFHKEYAKGAFSSRKTIARQEIVVLLAFIFAAGCGVVSKKILVEDLLTMVLPIGIGMTMLATALSYVHLLAFADKWRWMAESVGLLGFCTALLYALPVYFVKWNFSWAFLLSCVVYWLIGANIARKLELSKSTMFRYKQTIINVCLLVLGCITIKYGYRVFFR